MLSSSHVKVPSGYTYRLYFSWYGIATLDRNIPLFSHIFHLSSLFPSSIMSFLRIIYSLSKIFRFHSSSLIPFFSSIFFIIPITFFHLYRLSSITPIPFLRNLFPSSSPIFYFFSSHLPYNTSESIYCTCLS